MVSPSDGYDLSKVDNYSRPKKYTILDKASNGQECEIRAIKENSIMKFITFPIDSSHLRFTVERISKVKENDTIRVESQIIPYNLVNKSEIDKYPQLRDFSSINEDELIAVMQLAIELEEKYSNPDKHFIASELKYLLVELGINPNFEIGGLEYFINNSKNPTVKSLADKLKK